MRTKTTGWMLVSFLITAPFVTELVQAMPAQVTPAGTAKPVADNGRSKIDRTHTSANQAIARNTVGKTEAVPAKEQKVHDKKTIGRCWQRLIGTFREINFAHRNRTP